ncbi:MAG: glycosyltransferase family 39 protein, partial [Microthrixaceae bacterium]
MTGPTAPGSTAPGSTARGPRARGPRALTRKRFLTWLAAILAVGLTVRLGFVFIRQSSVELTGGDAFWYHFQAQLVADGRGFLHPFDYFKSGIVAPGADHPPGFILILAFLDLIGIGTPQGQRIVMCFVGTASLAVIAFVGRRLVSDRVGLIAAAIAAIYPNIWINDGMLMVETVFILASAVVLLGCYRYLDRPNRWDLVLIASALTVGAMTRPEAMALFGILVLPLVLARKALSWKERVAHLGIAALIPIVAFAPWVIYNLSRFDSPVWLSTGAGQTLAVGNCDLTFSGRNLGFYDTNCLLSPQIKEPTSTDRSVRDAEYRRIASDYIAEHRGELPKVIAARIGREWHLFRPGQSLGLDGWVEGRSGGPPGTGFQTVREALWAYYLLMPLGIAGLVLLRRRGRKIYPLLAQPLLVTLVAASTFGITRYRAGAEVALVLAAAVTISAIVDRLFPSADPHPTERAPDGTAPAGAPEGTGPD